RPAARRNGTVAAAGLRPRGVTLGAMRVTELYHITERPVWEAASVAGEYRMSTRGVALDEQGFIHLSLRHQLRAVAEFVYGDADDLVVLVIDSTRVTAPVPTRHRSPARSRTRTSTGRCRPTRSSRYCRSGATRPGRCCCP